MTHIYKRRREDALPTPRTALRTRYVRVLAFCNSCRHQADADLGAIVAAGRGDMPLTERPNYGSAPSGSSAPAGAA
jgi:hypothetical protein